VTCQKVRWLVNNLRGRQNNSRQEKNDKTTISLSFFQEKRKILVTTEKKNFCSNFLKWFFDLYSDRISHNKKIKQEDVGI
jgi:hypothetical protein